jgi:hypothetical protein
MDVALDMMQQHPEVRSLLDAMLHKEFPLSQGVEAMEYAQRRGVLKVQVVP